MAIRTDPERIARLRRGLAGANFDAASIGEALGREVGSSTHPGERPVLLRRAASADARLRTAIELFVLEQPVTPDEVDVALAPASADDLVELGLAHESGDRLETDVKLTAYDPFVIASDASAHSAAADLVMGFTRPAALLSQLMVRRPVRRALDLGTGNGILALLAARDAEHVIGTDINEHALEIAKLNAALNGVDNVEFRLGSFLEPVEGETFGLVVSNPPYVISPETSYMYRDSGLGGDRLSEQVLALVPQALEEDGFASVTISWIANSEAELAERPRAWLDGSGCDAWLLHTTTDDALATAAVWNRDVEDDPAQYAAQIDRWVDWYRAEGIAALAYGVCVLHRRTGRNWVRSTKLPAATVRESSDQLQRLFSAQEVLDDTGLLERRLEPAPDAVLRHSLLPGENGWSVDSSTLELAGGLGFTAALDGPSAAVVTALHGRTLREAFAAARAGADVDEVQFDAGALTLVRKLVELGFVVPG